MGWDYLRASSTERTTDVVRRELGSEHGSWVIEGIEVVKPRYYDIEIDSGKHPSRHRSPTEVAYVLVRTKLAEPAQKRYIVVVLVDRRPKEWAMGQPNGGYNFGYKTMEEMVGPNEDQAPRSLLERETAPENEYAREWRRRAWAHHGVDYDQLESEGAVA